MGGAELADLFREEGMIDEWIVTLIPKSIGGGVPLFGSPEENLEITAVEKLGDAFVQLRMSRRT